MAAFDELHFTRFDVWAIVGRRGIAVVETEQRELCLASLRRQGYGIESIHFGAGIAPAYATMNDLFRWEAEFGYELRWRPRGLQSRRPAGGV